MIKIYIILFGFFFLSFSPSASEFKEAKNTIEIRKNAMQGLWLRIKRLSPYVELNEQVDYGKDIAEQDAKEIEILLSRTKDMWPQTSNLSAKGYTNATPAVWALPEYFNKLYSKAEDSANKLRVSIENDNIKNTELAMCNLGNACGSCHANFRRLLTSQLANEVTGWSGKYIKDCN
ncbi:cytochrome c [Alphaproteobacteria bacterium]|nr:cytochrome c [Alphaproteobacteria bacterium]